MMALLRGTLAPAFTAPDQFTTPHHLPALERFTLLVFNPLFRRYGCRSCETSLLHELYPDLRAAGCYVYGLTYDPPHVNLRRTVDLHPIIVPMLSISRVIAERYQAALPKEHAWSAHIPLSISYLIDPSGMVLGVYPDPDPRVHAREVLRRIKTLVPERTL